MGTSYGQLGLKERIEIYRLRADGKSLDFIAKALARHKSTISRELQREGGHLFLLQTSPAPRRLLPKPDRRALWGLNYRRRPVMADESGTISRLRNQKIPPPPETGRGIYERICRRRSWAMITRIWPLAPLVFLPPPPNPSPRGGGALPPGSELLPPPPRGEGRGGGRRRKMGLLPPCKQGYRQPRWGKRAKLGHVRQPV